jgi:hypothetical protein
MTTRKRQQQPPPKAFARCGSCRALFRDEFIDLTRPPSRCPLCFGLGTFWVDESGVPIGRAGARSAKDEGRRSADEPSPKPSYRCRYDSSPKEYPSSI